MKNIKVEQKNNTLVLTIDLSKDLGVSGSQKSIIIASTEGNQKLAELKDGTPVVVGLSVYKKNPDYVKPGVTK